DSLRSPAGILPLGRKPPGCCRRTTCGCSTNGSWATSTPSSTDPDLQPAASCLLPQRDKGSTEHAAAALRMIARGREPRSPSNAPHYAAMTPLNEAVVGRSRKAVLIFLGIAVMLLLIACANVASLLFARAKARKREVAVRTALARGAGVCSGSV